MNNIQITDIPPDTIFHVLEPNRARWEETEAIIHKALPGITILFSQKPLTFIRRQEFLTLAEGETKADTLQSQDIPADSTPGEAQVSKFSDLITNLNDYYQNTEPLRETIKADLDAGIKRAATISEDFARDLYREQFPKIFAAAELPELHAGLTFPADAEYLRFLGDYTRDAQETVGHDDFNRLRLMARQLGRTDRELICSIRTFKRIKDKQGNILPVPKLIECVENSLKAAHTAELAAKQSKTDHPLTPPTDS